MPGLTCSVGTFVIIFHGTQVLVSAVIEMWYCAFNIIALREAAGPRRLLLVSGKNCLFFFERSDQRMCDVTDRMVLRRGACPSELPTKCPRAVLSTASI